MFLGHFNELFHDRQRWTILVPHLMSLLPCEFIQGRDLLRQCREEFRNVVLGQGKLHDVRR